MEIIQHFFHDQIYGFIFFRIGSQYCCFSLDVFILNQFIPTACYNLAGGFRGGFRLARPARRITLREIVEALQGPIEFHRCLDHIRAGGRRGRCRVKRVFRDAQRKVSAILEQTTLEDILEVNP